MALWGGLAEDSVDTDPVSGHQFAAERETEEMAGEGPGEPLPLRQHRSLESDGALEGVLAEERAAGIDVAAA